MKSFWINGIEIYNQRLELIAISWPEKGGRLAGKEQKKK